MPRSHATPPPSGAMPPPTVDRARLTDRGGFLVEAGLTVGGLAVMGLSACGGSSQGGSVSGGGTYSGQQAVSHLDEIIAAAPFKIAESGG